MTKDTKQPDTPGKSGSDSIHDHYFRSRFRFNAQFRILSKLVFTARQVSWLDLDTLRLEDSVSVSLEGDKSVKRSADLVLSVSLKQGPGRVFIVVEHKSYPDHELMPQLWRYQARCFERGADEVILVTVCHGCQPTFSRSRTFRGYRKNVLPAEFVDDFSHTVDHDGSRHDLSVNFGTALIDLRKAATRKCLAQLPLSATKLGLQLLSTIWEADEDSLYKIVDQSEGMETDERCRLIDESMVYICKAHPESFTIDDMIKLIKERYRGDSFMENLSEAWSWIADDLREEARSEGLEQGLKDVAKNLIEEGMTVQKISTVTGLSVQQVERIQNGN